MNRWHVTEGQENKRGPYAMATTCGRYRIERIQDHRGDTFICWDMRPDFDFGWMLIDVRETNKEARDLVRLANKYGGTP